MEFSSPWKQICRKSISSLWFSGFWKETIWQWFSQWPFTVGEANAVSESREKKMIIFPQDKLKTHMMRNHGYSNDDIKNTFKQTTPGRQRSSIVVNRWNVNVDQVGAIWKKENEVEEIKKMEIIFFLFSGSAQGSWCTETIVSPRSPAPTRRMTLKQTPSI